MFKAFKYRLYPTAPQAVFWRPFRALACDSAAMLTTSAERCDSAAMLTTSAERIDQIMGRSLAQGGELMGMIHGYRICFFR